jgi:acyl-CoA thioesterase-1
MLRRWRLDVAVGVACLLLSGCSACDGISGVGFEKLTPGQAKAPGPSIVPSAKDDTRPKIVVLGDSLTAGLGLLDTQSYPGLLQSKIDADGFKFEVINGGVSGDTSAGGLRRLDWLLTNDVQVLIVALGGNDGLRGLSAADMKENLSRIIETARDKHITVILAGMEAPPNFGTEYSSAFRQTFQQLALEYRLPFIPFLLDKVAGQAALNQADGIHPNAQGAAIVADTVWNVLKPVLDQLSSS